jgi:hypothetical protein
MRAGRLEGIGLCWWDWCEHGNKIWEAEVRMLAVEVRLGWCSMMKPNTADNSG